jgi:hypothetical protein
VFTYPEAKNARRGEALTEEAMKTYRWVRPELAAEVSISTRPAALPRFGARSPRQFWLVLPSMWESDDGGERSFMPAE